MQRSHAASHLGDAKLRITRGTGTVGTGGVVAFGCDHGPPSLDVAIDLGANGSVGGYALGKHVPTGDLVELARVAAPWMRDGACREHPEVSFLAELGESLEPARIRAGTKELLTTRPDAAKRIHQRPL